jgi:hypothetical protein
MKTLTTAVALTTAMLVSSAAAAESFTIFVYERPADLALRSDTTARGQAYWADYARFADALQKAGAIRGGAPLQLPQQGRVIRSGGPSRGVDGALGAGGLHLGGYFNIEAPDLDAAAALAAQAPSVRRGGAAEVRATYPAPAMSAR